MRNSCTLLVSSFWIVIFLLLTESFCEKNFGGHEEPCHSKIYMVLFQSKKSPCVGILITKDWMLTAAYCDLEKKIRVLRIHPKIKNKAKLTMNVKKVFPYPCYNPKTNENDLKLVQLNKHATINENVDILKLLNFSAKGNDVKPNSKCEVLEWGKVGNNATSDTLEEVNVIDRKICNDENHCNFKHPIKDIICTRNPKGGKDSHKVHPGSPLICEGKIRGVTSFACRGKCGDTCPTYISTRLTEKKVNWIRRTMKRAV